MNKEISPKLIALTFGILTVSFLAVFYVVAWTEPSQVPPSGNVPTPLNIGSTGQSKAGGLILNTGGAVNGLIVGQGNVGIGTTTPAYKLDVQGGQINASGGLCIAGNCKTNWPGEASGGMGALWAYRTWALSQQRCYSGPNCTGTQYSCNRGTTVFHNNGFLTVTVTTFPSYWCAPPACFSSGCFNFPAIYDLYSCAVGYQKKEFMMPQSSWQELEYYLSSCTKQ